VVFLTKFTGKGGLFWTGVGESCHSRDLASEQDAQANTICGWITQPKVGDSFKKRYLILLSRSAHELDPFLKSIALIPQEQILPRNYLYYR